ncbi:hypothetical protein [Rufibacter latericius]|uniref:Uncharacterized protein n=1 Tax=Rufibacter latericius TaxID=2487040 RepID=A0A3M9MY78_9BACT|nr:hypothetical protein [Rufibacter latericius]RNI30450.1 hypothetical protein EFB08_04070 [Rufibacter latericius]
MEKLIILYSLLILGLVVVLLVLTNQEEEAETGEHLSRNEKVQSGLVCLINLIILDLSWRVFPWKEAQPEGIFASVYLLFFTVLCTLSCGFLLYHLFKTRLITGFKEPT